MSENDSLLVIMTKDHRKIETLLDKLVEIKITDFNRMKDAFHKFEWELEKHIFVEEKAIFTVYNPENVSEGYIMLPELTKQHNFILNQLHNMRLDIHKKKRLVRFEELKHVLIRHKKFEEGTVYPKLDQVLDIPQKRGIIDRIRTII